MRSVPQLWPARTVCGTQLPKLALQMAESRSMAAWSQGKGGMPPRGEMFYVLTMMVFTHVKVFVKTLKHMLPLYGKHT